MEVSKATGILLVYLKFFSILFFFFGGGGGVLISLISQRLERCSLLRSFLTLFSFFLSLILYQYSIQLTLRRFLGDK